MNYLRLSSGQLICRLFKSLIIVFAVTAGSYGISWAGSPSGEHAVISPFSLVKDTQQLSREELREIFFGRQTRWPDGSPLRVFVLPDKHPVHIRFAKEILGIYPYQLRSAWDRMIYSGTGTPPVIVESLEQMQLQIERTPGAIGYIVK